jgi:hypothetical protein
MVEEKNRAIYLKGKILPTNQHSSLRHLFPLVQEEEMYAQRVTSWRVRSVTSVQAMLQLAAIANLTHYNTKTLT